MKLMLGNGEPRTATQGLVYHNLRDGDLPRAWQGQVHSISAPGVLAEYESGRVYDFLRDWSSMLIPGGELLVSVPNMPAIAKALADGKTEIDYAATIYGEGGHQRRSMWDEGGLAVALKANGFPHVERVVGETDYTLILRARTATQSLGPDGKIRGVYGVMSVPRVGFVGNQITTTRIGVQCGIDFTFQQTVFWGQGLTIGIEEAIAKGARYVLAMDYDTYALPRHAYDLVRIMDQHPEIDALAAGQMRRGVTQLLASSDGEGYRAFMNCEEIAPATTAHFGFTLLRTEAFAELETPWFVAKPDPDGSWHEGKIDEDITFWRDRWAGAGLKLAVCPQVCVGHFEHVMACVGHDGSKVFVPDADKDRAHILARF